MKSLILAINNLSSSVYHSRGGGKIITLIILSLFFVLSPILLAAIFLCYAAEKAIFLKTKL